MSEQYTEDQRAVQEMLQKTVKRVGGIPREVPETTISNFLTIFRHDKTFSGLTFNVMSGRAERVCDTGRREWNAADDSWSRGYIERVYGIHSQSKWQDAFIQMQQERRFHPLQKLVGSVPWDGIPRCERFLIDWMKAEDTPYNREVSRLLFAGGINRLYDAGCKFDCVPVLIGGQGSGKSTLCHWLALEDSFYNSINTIEGQKGAEGIQGVWVCEIENYLRFLPMIGQGASMRNGPRRLFPSRTSIIASPMRSGLNIIPVNAFLLGQRTGIRFLRTRPEQDAGFRSESIQMQGTCMTMRMLARRRFGRHGPR